MSPNTHGSPKDIQKLLRAAVRAGWTLSGGGRKHWKLYKPGEGCFFVGGSSSDSYAARKVRNDMRKRGIDV